MPIFLSSIWASQARLLGAVSFFHVFDVASQTLVFVGHILESQHIVDSFDQFDLLYRFGQEIIGAAHRRPVRYRPVR